jgi:hypothetical protein
MCKEMPVIWSTGWWTRKEYLEKGRAEEEERHKGSLTKNKRTLLTFQINELKLKGKYALDRFHVYFFKPKWRHVSKPLRTGNCAKTALQTWVARFFVAGHTKMAAKCTKMAEKCTKMAAKCTQWQ